MLRCKMSLGKCFTRLLKHPEITSFYAQIILLISWPQNRSAGSQINAEERGMANNNLSGLVF